MPQPDHVEALDRSVEKTYEWLRDLRSELGDACSRQQAYSILRGVLQTLRDRLTVDEAVEFASQLPQQVRGVYFEGWEPSKVPLKFDREEFLSNVESAATLPDDVRPADAVRATGRVLQQRVDSGELRDVLTSLPRDLRAVLGGSADV